MRVSSWCREHRGDREQAGAAESDDAERPPAPLRAQAPDQGVTRGATREVRARRDRVRQRRQQQAPLGEPASLHQKRVKPRLEEAVDVDVAEGRPDHRQDGLGTECDPPGETMPGAGATGLIASSSSWLTPGFSAGVSRNQAYHTAAQITPDAPNTIEGCAPAVANLNRHDQERRDGAANLARHQQHPGHARALGRRKPARDDDGCVRKRARFAGAKENLVRRSR